MSISDFAEKYLGVKLHKYQKKMIDQMGELCSKCQSERRSICKAYGGYCDKWKRLKDRSSWVSFFLTKPEKF